MTACAPVRIVHADELTVDDFDKLRCPAPDLFDDRFVVFALRARYVVGYWTFLRPMKRRWGPHRGVVIHSVKTWVSRACRRQGIATQLWRAGVERWQPDVIHADVGSAAGRDLLCALIQIMRPLGVRIEIDTGGDFDVAEIYKDAFYAPVRPVAPVQLKLVAKGTR